MLPRAPARECATAAEHYWEGLGVDVDVWNDYTSHFNSQRSECLIRVTHSVVTGRRVIVDDDIENAVDRTRVANRHEDSDASKKTDSVVISGSPFPSDQRAAQQQWLDDLMRK